MGFYIADYEVELKQHLNLSDEAWAVIYEDIRNFYITEDRQSFSGFLNRVFENFYQKALSTISLRYTDKHSEYISLFSSKEFPSKEKSVTELYVSKLLKRYEADLMEKVNSYSKGSGKKFRINKSNLELLRCSSDSIYYEGNIGKYLKAIFEEYAEKQSFERELIFFDEYAEKIQYAISQQKKLKISLMSKISVDSKTLYTRNFYVSPYKIMHDKTGNFNYLVGYAEEIYEDGTVSKKRTASFRISRIDKIAIMKSMSAFISKPNQENLNREILAKTPQFMAGDVIDITISFTKKGLENLDRQIYMRPDKYTKLSNDTYVFSCTEVQALNYFFKFGKDAKILAPDYLSEKIANRYKEAWEAYNR